MTASTGYGYCAGFLRALSLMTAAGILVSGGLVGPVAAAKPDGYSRAQYVLPAEVKAKGISFAGSRIPLNRPDVAERVVDQMNYLLMDRRSGMMEWFDRMAVSGPMIRRVIEKENLPVDLVYLAALLSDFVPNATRKSGGIGWWALGAGAQKKNSATSWLSTPDWDDRRDPVLSTQIACTLFKGLHEKFKGSDWLIAISAFVDGADRIETIVRTSPGFSYWDLVMPPYSDVLISRLVALKIIDTHRAFYGVEVPSLPALSYDYLDRLKLTKDLPLHVVAKWCGTNGRAIWELNPGVDPSNGVLPKPDKRSPDGFPLRVPKGMGEKVKMLLSREGYLGK